MSTTLPPFGGSRGIYAITDQVLQAVRATEQRLAAKLPFAHVAAHGARIARLKDGLVDIHEAWYALHVQHQAFTDAVRRGRAELPDIVTSLIALAAVAAKVAADVQSVVDEAELARRLACAVPIAISAQAAVDAILHTNRTLTLAAALGDPDPGADAYADDDTDDD